MQNKRHKKSPLKTNYCDFHSSLHIRLYHTLRPTPPDPPHPARPKHPAKTKSNGILRPWKTEGLLVLYAMSPLMYTIILQKQCSRYFTCYSGNFYSWPINPHHPLTAQCSPWKYVFFYIMAQTAAVYSEILSTYSLVHVFKVKHKKKTWLNDECLEQKQCSPPKYNTLTVRSKQLSTPGAW